jgi:hypothetical protein
VSSLSRGVKFEGTTRDEELVSRDGETVLRD